MVDLTAKMSADGRLDWDVPAGKWMVLRMGYSLTSQKNGPAPPEATGYEVDKLSRKHIASYYDAYLAPVTEAMGPLLGKSLQYLLVDSWEAGMQNWSEEILGEFATRRGYDPRPFLPVLTGRVVDSTEVSERFLWDFRRTIADVLADVSLRAARGPAAQARPQALRRGGGRQLAHAPGRAPEQGARGHPHGRVLDAASRPGPPARTRHGRPRGRVGRPRLRQAAGGRRILHLVRAGVERRASRLKWLGDYYMSLGVNRFVIHTSVHQPFLDRRPGMTLGPFGQHFTRNNTWAEQSRGWISDLTRSSYLLQQGLFVGDLAYYYGEGVPASVTWATRRRPHPSRPPATPTTT